MARHLRRGEIIGSEQLTLTVVDGDLERTNDESGDLDDSVLRAEEESAAAHTMIVVFA